MAKVNASGNTTPIHPTPLFLNSDSMAGKIENTFTTHYLIENHHGPKIVALSPSRAGIVMSKANGYDAWLKSDFQKLAQPHASSELRARAVYDFKVSENQIQNLCTVGCGTNVILHLNDGLFFVAVERSSQKKTDAGSVNASAYSRAAGGSTGNIDLTAFTEINEELFIVANISGMATSLTINPKIYQVDQQEKDIVLKKRRDRYPYILNAHGVKNLALDAHLEIDSPCLEVKNLTETIIERTVSGDKALTSRVFAHSPEQMDINGIDAVTLVSLPSLSSKDIVGIYDGEENNAGELLKRKWSLKPLAAMHTELVMGQIKMSPAPARVVKAAADVTTAIHAELNI